ncbi:SMC-Scp complex subunit ScpB [Corynebacterium sp. CCM 9204]
MSEEPDLPAPASVTALRSQIESILLVIDTPVGVDTLSTVLGAAPGLVTEVLEEIRDEFDARGSGFDLRSSAEGWRLYTRSSNAGVVEKLILDGGQSRLSRAALETLAVVAYRQPVTRAQVSAVRGVNVDGVMRTLQLRGLIREVEVDHGTGAHRYATTELLLELLGVDSLDRLPDLAPLLPDVDTIDEDY